MILSLLVGLGLFGVTVLALVAVGRVAAIATLLGVSAFAFSFAVASAREGALLMVVLLFILAIAFIVVACVHVWRAEGARNWQVALGWVATAGTRDETDSDGDTTFTPEVTYTYEVGGGRTSALP